MSHTEVVSVPETGLVKADFDIRLYDGAGDAVADPGFTVTEIADRRYSVAGLPDGSTSDPHTFTYRTPSVVGAKRWPTLVSPPDAVVVALGVTGEEGTLSATLYRDAELYAGATLTIDEPASGDYLITGIPDLSGSWKLVVESTLSIVEVDWPGVASGILVTAADLRDWLGIVGTEEDDLLTAAEARVVSWLERETYRRLRTGVVTPILRGPRGIETYVRLPSAITATDDSGSPHLNSLEIRGGLGSDWETVDLDTVEIVPAVDLETHDLHLTSGWWPRGVGAVRPTYLTGYQAEGEPQTPGDLELAVCEQVADHWFSRSQQTKNQTGRSDARMDRLVDATIRRYTNPYKHETFLDRMVV